MVLVQSLLNFVCDDVLHHGQTREIVGSIAGFLEIKERQRGPA